MKLCVIGNSHVGMLRAALRDMADRGEAAPDCTFFAKAGNGIEKAVIRGAVISAEDPDLRAAQARFAMPAEIDVATFDATLLVAGTASIYTALTILQDYRVSGWPSCPRAPEPSRPHAPSADKPLVSEPAYVAALADQARAGYAYRFAMALRAATDKPLFLLPQPYPSERVFESARPTEYGFHRARRHGEGPNIAAALDRAIALAFAGIPDLDILHQPADTVAHGFTTARAYTRDAVRVDGRTAQHAADLLHVGPAFGRQVLARVALGLKPGLAA